MAGYWRGGGGQDDATDATHSEHIEGQDQPNETGSTGRGRSKMTFGENDMATLDADRDRETFRRCVAESRRLIKDGDAEGANAATAELEPTAERWHVAGRLIEYLSPLLAADEPPYVRFNAATYLLTHGHEDAALTALEELKAASVGAASRDAGLILGDWRQRQS